MDIYNTMQYVYTCIHIVYILKHIHTLIKPSTFHSFRAVRTTITHLSVSQEVIIAPLRHKALMSAASVCFITVACKKYNWGHVPPHHTTAHDACSTAHPYSLN